MKQQMKQVNMVKFERTKPHKTNKKQYSQSFK